MIHKKFQTFADVMPSSSPRDVAHAAVQETLDLAGAHGNSVLTIGEQHHIFSHQITQALALKELIDSGENVTLFVEYPHNRLYTVLLDRGYNADDALKLAEHISQQDENGHILAKALIGGKDASLGGNVFGGFQSELLLQIAMQHNVRIAYPDAARVYPMDFCLDFSDLMTDEIARRIGAKRGNAGEMGADDMLIRNTCMAENIKATLAQHGGVGLYPVGAAHCFGIEDEYNGFHSYKDSLAERFKDVELPAVVTSMLPNAALPHDYEFIPNQQRRSFDSPSDLRFIEDMSDADIQSVLLGNGLDPDLYDPRNYAESYSAEFDNILKQAEEFLGIKRPVHHSVSNLSGAAPRFQQ
jgi:hypothetical protein